MFSPSAGTWTSRNQSVSPTTRSHIGETAPSAQFPRMVMVGVRKKGKKHVRIHGRHTWPY